MSRRFGRNQRRRARERIAELEIASTAATSTAQREERRANSYKAVLDGIGDALGTDSVLLDPILRRAMNHFLPSIELVEAMDLGKVVPWDASREPVATIRRHTADVFSAGISEDHWARTTHFRVQFRDRGITAYAIDHRALEQAKLSRALRTIVERNIAREMARMFMDELAKVGAV